MKISKKMLVILLALTLALVLPLSGFGLAFAEEDEASNELLNEAEQDEQGSEDPDLDELNSLDSNDIDEEENGSEEDSLEELLSPLMTINPSVAAAPLAAGPVTPGLYTIASSINTSMVFDIPAASTSPEAIVQLWNDNLTPAQRFVFIQNSDGSFTIKNVNSGLVLDVRWAIAANGTVVWQHTPNGSNAQKWILTPSVDGSGTYRIASMIDQKYCLDVPGANASSGARLQIYEDNGTAAQKFHLSKIDPVIPDGVYFVGSSASNKVADVQWASSDNSTPIQLYELNRTLAQRFLFIFDNQTGYYTITNVNSAKVLDVMYAGYANGTPVQIFERNGTNAQKWAIHEISPGKYRLTAAHSGLVFSFSGNSSTNGTKIQTNAWNNSSSQLWTLTATQAYDDGVYQIRSALGTVLDAKYNGQTNGTQIWTHIPNGTFAQKFYLKHVGNEYYTFECLNSGRAISIESAGSNRVILYDYNASDNQLWKLVYSGEGKFVFQNKATGKVLDVTAASPSPETNVQIYPLNWTNAQRWSFEPVDPLPEGLYVVSSALASNKVLDILGNSTADGAKLQLHEANGTSAQIFRFFKVSNQYYRIVGLSSNKSLDVQSATINPSTGFGHVQLFTTGSNDNRAQLWKIEYAGDRCFRIVSALGDQTSCLDVTDSSTADCTDVDVRRINNQPNQSFRFIPAGNTANVPLSITIDQMVQYQRTNTYINSISDQQLRDVIDPALAMADYWFPGHSQQYRFGLYQFADLRSYSGLTAAQLNSIIEGNSLGRNGKLRGQGAAFVTAAQTYGLNECYLLAHAVLESGWGTSQLATGYSYNGTTLINGQTYPAGTYYNFFGVGAVDSSPLSGGQAYAIMNGWDSPEKAIIGGAKWIAENYIYRSIYGQPTLYAMKWDYSRSNATFAYGWHQYATDHLWARKIANIMGGFYSELGVTPNLFYFIPQYR